MTSRIIHSGRWPLTAEGVDHLEPLGGLQPADLAGLGAHHDAQLLGQLVDVDPRQELLDRLGAHARVEGASPYWSRSSRKRSSVRSSCSLRSVSPGSMTT